MSELLPLSRAARLVGVSRGQVQRKIKEGKLQTFEGMVRPADLLRAFPHKSLKTDDPNLKRVAEIRENAYGRRLRDTVLPDAEVLAARLKALSGELTGAIRQRNIYRDIIAGLRQQLADGGEPAADLLYWLERQLSTIGLPDDESGAIEIEDQLLRVMAAQVRLQPSGHDFFVEGQDSILDAALRAGLAMDYGCSNGNCGLCKGRILKGEVKKTRHHDFVIPEAEKSQGYVLLCSHTAVTDLLVEAEEAESASEMPRQEVRARVKRLELLGTQDAILHLQTPRNQRLRFLAGQSARLSARGEEAELGIASCPCDDRNLQFHLHRGENFADKALELHPNDYVDLVAPQGSFVLRDDSPRSLLFVAFGGGFARIKSLVEHAMSLDAAESMHLYWVATADTGHYLHNLCRSWDDALDDFHYRPVAADAALDPAKLAGDIATRQREFLDFDVFVCGPRELAEPLAAVMRDRGLPENQLRVEFSER